MINNEHHANHHAGDAGLDKLVRGLEAWAAEPMAGEPLDPAALRAQAEAAGSHCAGGARNENWRVTWKRWLWPLAAAALLALVAGQWFVLARARPGGGAELAELRQRVRELTAQAEIDRRLVQQVSLNAAALQTQLTESTTRLVQMQQIESNTRYQDIQRLIQWQSQGSGALAYSAGTGAARP